MTSVRRKMARPRLELIPIALLLVVFAVQRIHIHTQGLTPWMGGGFSMFTTVDMPHARHLRLYSRATRAPIPLPDDIDDLRLESALHLPDARRLRALAAEIEVSEPATLEVWTISYHRRSGEVHAHRLARIDIDP